jgi:hypothetical protein
MKKQYSIVFRQFNDIILSLCLENGVTAEGKTKDESLSSLQDAIESLESVMTTDKDVLITPIAINELHEFLNYQGKPELYYELKPIYA